MKRDFILNRIIKVMLLVLSMTVGQNALAESTWEVTNNNGNSNTFTIKRSEKGYEQTVHFRTISLSAYAGQHFTAVDMDYTFPATEDTKTVTVSESTPSGAFVYQTAASRKYGFEVTDRGGFQLAYAERSKTWGTSVTGSGVFSEKDVTIHSGEVTVTDGGYAQSSNPYTINSSSYCNAGTQAYLSFLNAQLRMTLNFQAKEKSDGYQYVQILVNNTTDCDTGAGDGNPGTISLSCYMAGFTIGGKGVDTYYNYSFPVTTVGNDAGATKPWTGINNTVADLEKQKFNTDCRATDGKLIIPTNFTTLVVRLNASGSDNDDWYAKNIKANIIAVDATAPTKSAVSVNPGRHAKGNTVYVSVAFSEIVTVAGTPTLTTTSDNHWGSLSYVTGSGTNVLTFSTTIPQDATGNLNVTGYSGTITDLAGNAPSSVTASSLCSLDDDLAYTLSDFQQEGGAYLISCRDDLRGLAGYVSGGNNCSGLTFRQVADIAFAHTTNWNNSSSTENNFTAIGDDDHPFQGTYDGDGHTISGIRIYKGGDKGSDNRQGLFGKIGRGGTVKRVTLADARITGRDYTGGIAGDTFSCTIEDCTVEADVCIHAVQISTKSHGGIVGINHADLVRRCISRATLTVADASYCNNFGGIVGFNTDCITDCIAEGVVIPDVNGRGAIVGYKSAGTLSRNYYRGCTVAGVANATGVGQGTSESSTETSDPAGARTLYALSLPANTVIVRTPSATLPGSGNATYTTGADIGGQTYAIATSKLRLSYDSATLSEGYTVRLTASETSGGAPVALTYGGDYTYRFTMPAAAVTVEASVVQDLVSYIDADGNEQTVSSPTGIGTDITTYGNAENTEAWYYVDGTVNYNKHTTLTFNDQHANIILCDGALLGLIESGGNFTFIDAKGALTIYAQSGGTGSIVCNKGAGSGITAMSDLELNGGVITATSTNLFGLYASGNIIIRRGSVTAVGGQYAIQSYDGSVTIYGGTVTAESRDYAVLARKNIIIYGGTVTANATGTDYDYLSGLCTRNGDVSILGGNVTATGQTGIIAGYTSSGNWGYRTVTLGWSSPDDRITASSYACSTLAVKSGQILTDGTNYYSGTLDDTQKTAMAGRMLQPAVTYSIMLPEHVSASGTVTRLNGTTYAPAGVPVTLSTETGIILSSVTVNGTPATDNGDGTWSYSMPAQDVTVAATVTMPPVTYIDADGIEQSRTYYTLLTSDDDISNATNNQGYLPGGWYVVDGDIDCNSLQFSGDVHIILADGARLYVNCGINSRYDLTIYGQAAGSGELSLPYPISCNNICINGGIINNYNGTCGIQANGNVTINGGTIHIESGNDYGIYANGYVTINGGTLSFNSIFGIVTSNVILASSTSLKTLNITRDFYVYTISLDRTFTVGKPATLMLPFYMDVNDISGGTFYTFGGVEKENDRWVATMNAVTDYIEPNTPYLVMPTETSLTFNNATVLCTNGGGGGQTADEGSNWTFKGTYDYIKWTTDTSDPDYTAERAAEIGRVYGFAGVQKDGIEVGDFVKVASGARIRPMSAYLMWSDTPNAQNAPMRGSSRTGSAQELPQSITVRLLDASGTVTNVGEIDTVTGEISFEGWYTLQGVKLDAEPTEPGIYINNGKTVSIQK